MMRIKFGDTQAALGFVISQTTHIQNVIYAKKYPNLTYRQRVFVDTSPSAYAKTVTYFGMDERGSAAWLSGNAQDVPMVDMTMSKYEESVFTAGIGYGFGLEEIGAAAEQGVNLSSFGAQSARDRSEEFNQKVAFTGDASNGLNGLFNHPSATTGAVPNGAGGSATWASKTGDEIAKDINDAISGIHTSTLGLELADTVIIPLAQFNLIATKRMGSADAERTSMTVLEYIRKNNVYTAQTGQPLNLVADINVTGIGAGATDRMVVYQNNPDVCRMYLPMALRFIAPQAIGLRIQVPGMFRLGGVDVLRPAAMRYYDGI